MKKLLIPFTLCISMFANAQVPKPQPNTYVNDATGSLSAEQIRQLNLQIRQLETTSGVQFAIVLVNDLPANMEIDDYAREIGRTWHVGNAKNGLVYVVSLNSHKQRLEVARELEGTLPDITCKEITDGIKPFFRSKDYFGGCSYLVQQIQSKIKPVAAEQKALLKKPKAAEQDDNYGLLIGFAILFLLGVLYAIHIATRRKSYKKNKEVIWDIAVKNGKATTEALTTLINSNMEKKSKKLKKKNKLGNINHSHNIANTLPPPPPRHSTSKSEESQRKVSSGSGSTLAAGALGALVGYELGKHSNDNDDENISTNTTSTNNDDDFGKWGSDNNDSTDNNDTFSSDSGSGFDGGGATNDF